FQKGTAVIGRWRSHQGLPLAFQLPDRQIFQCRQPCEHFRFILFLHQYSPNRALGPASLMLLAAGIARELSLHSADIELDLFIILTTPAAMIRPTSTSRAT